MQPDRLFEKERGESHLEPAADVMPVPNQWAVAQLSCIARSEKTCWVLSSASTFW